MISKHIKCTITTDLRICDGCEEFMKTGRRYYRIGFGRDYSDLCTSCVEALARDIELKRKDKPEQP